MLTMIYSTSWNSQHLLNDKYVCTMDGLYLQYTFLGMCPWVAPMLEIYILIMNRVWLASVRHRICFLHSWLSWSLLRLLLVFADRLSKFRKLSKQPMPILEESGRESTLLLSHWFCSHPRLDMDSSVDGLISGAPMHYYIAANMTDHKL